MPTELEPQASGPAGGWLHWLFEHPNWQAVCWLRKQSEFWKACVLASEHMKLGVHAGWLHTPFEQPLGHAICCAMEQSEFWNAAMFEFMHIGAGVHVWLQSEGKVTVKGVGDIEPILPEVEA